VPGPQLQILRPRAVLLEAVLLALAVLVGGVAPGGVAQPRPANQHHQQAASTGRGHPPSAGQFS
jgi:hypothetical protein